MRDTVKRLQVTFADSLPMGTRGTFTHGGELWIAYPAKKNQRINAALDRMLGEEKRIIDEMIRWMNQRPGDADLITRVCQIIRETAQLRSEMLVEKAKAVTM